MSQVATIHVPGRTGEIKVPTGLFINNEFVPSVDSKEVIDAINPLTEEVICSVTCASAKDIDVAVAAARKAFNTTWGKNVTGFERARLINKLADLIEQNAQELGELESLNNGKPVRIARDFDIGDSVQCLRYYAGWADKIAGQTLEIDNKTKFAFTKHEPIGVCGQIIPLELPDRKVAPALAVGCTIVMKPSELTPLTALKLSELVKEAGFPPGVLNTVQGLGSVAGSALAAHPDVDKVAFTGSTITGRKIMEAAAKSNLKKVSLELGGKSPHLIFESCDMDQAANWAALGICYNSGQARLHRWIAVKELVFGNGFESETSGGPVVSKAQYDKIWGYIESGKQEGAKVVLGGNKRSGKGFFVDPTIFTDIRPNMKIVKEEASFTSIISEYLSQSLSQIFGPVLSVGRFTTEAEAISLANDTTYGLGAGLHSSKPIIKFTGPGDLVAILDDANQCMRVASALEAGTVWINQYNILHTNTPFGGKKQSVESSSIPFFSSRLIGAFFQGDRYLGRELGSYALEEYTSVKAVHWNFGEKLDWPL
ncbi:Aldehyde dehydrogenase [Mycena sanguinolenta]|uniref:Aldehyde dehydrogenase n=1 Tax=Mycena sanguinolenta TaxID=230812 RepID=A0A8H6Y8K6_9AGAR|nr:Aldehyde dehydrogenase [Mycena sanguinolenta]